jgi:hypothetical protein
VALRVVGAGLGRTGTNSLKLALEQLLGAPCYHMIEVFGRPDDIPVWHRAAEGDMPDWRAFPSGYSATVDWPAASFWSELAAANPDAIVLLSIRDADEWWRSAHATIFEVMRRPIPPDPVASAQLAMIDAVLRTRFTAEWDDEEAAKRAYVAHNERVRDAVPRDRLVEWRPGDGWKPICDALDVAVPDDPFPHVNTTADFRAMLGIES